MIGIFDSGSGGLTVLSELIKRAPSADFLYFGDIANAPYGTKTENELRVLTIRAAEFLIRNGAWDIVSACNSISARNILQDHMTDSRLIEMVEPTVAALAGNAGEILVVGTPATIRAGIYQSAFSKKGKEIHALAIGPLAKLIEEGAPDSQIATVIEESLRSVPPMATLLLGCTHYPLVLRHFKNYWSGAVVDPSAFVARTVLETFNGGGKGFLHFVITRDSVVFRNWVEKLFPSKKYTIEVI